MGHAVTKDAFLNPMTVGFDELHICPNIGRRDILHGLDVPQKIDVDLHQIRASWDVLKDAFRVLSSASTRVIPLYLYAYTVEQKSYLRHGLSPSHFTY